MNLADSLYANARIVPIKEPNKVKTVKKLDDGSLSVTLNSGKQFTLGPEDEQFQVFVIYSVIADL